MISAEKAREATDKLLEVGHYVILAEKKAEIERKIYDNVSLGTTYAQVYVSEELYGEIYKWLHEAGYHMKNMQVSPEDDAHKNWYHVKWD
jgi:hypothetical protein